MLSEKGLSSFNVLLIPNYTCLFVGVEQFAESMVVPAISQDVETHSALTLVIRLLDIFLFKEKSKVILSHSEDALVRKSWHLFVVVQRRSVYLKLVRRLISLHIS